MAATTSACGVCIRGVWMSRCVISGCCSRWLRSSTSRAADRLHLTQQALSGQIRQLEERVGTRLVDRDPRRVELTASGKAPCEQGRPLLSGAEQAVAAARAASGETARLTVGYIAPLTRRMAAPALSRFQNARPDVALTIHFAEWLDPLGGLRGGPADVAILYGEFENSGIELRSLFREPRGIALPADHPLAEGDHVTLEDYLAEPIVDVPVQDPVWRDFWAATRHRSRPPHIGATVRSLDGLIEAVASGFGVAATIAPAVNALGSGAGVVFRPVEGLEPLEFWVACRQHDDREEVRQFVETAANTLQEPSALATPDSTREGPGSITKT